MPGQRIQESVRTLPHDHDGVYGDKNTGLNTRVYLDFEDFLALGKPAQIEVVVKAVR